MNGLGTGPPQAEPSGIRTREELASALTALRTRAGLSVRTLAQGLDTPTATVGDYCSGRHLPGPGQQQLFCAMLRMCGVEEHKLDEWLDAVARLRVGSDRRMRRVSSPYQGLEPFQALDHERFFGREAVTDEALQRLRAQIAGAAPNGLLLVVGPSGAGKSSLLRAGVQAQIEAGGLDAPKRSWTSCLLSPGEAPFDALRHAIADLSGQGRVVIVDQLEEAFAVPATDQERFFRELQGLAESGALVLAGLRADFYEQAIRVPTLLASLRAEPLLIGPMTVDELRSAIVGPARYAGAQVDDGLVELLVTDLAPRAATGFAHDAGALPLLSHALLQCWQRAGGNRMTIADYRASGGLQGAVRQTAEELYTELTVAQRKLARRVFMRLVRVPEDGPTVRRRAWRHELEAFHGGDEAHPGAEAALAAGVVDRFVAARLITIGADTVELSHEALLTAWPRLAAWIERDRDGLRLHRQLTDAANDWIAAKRDPALLLRGSRLQLIAEWASEQDARAELNADERALLTHSEQLALAERRNARRRARQMRAMITASLLLAVAALALAGIALNASRSAAVARDNALSRQLALEAESLAPDHPNLAMQLAVLAHRTADTTGATSALLQVSDGEMPTRALGPTGPAYLSIAADVKRAAVAYSAADSIRLYTLAGAVPRLAATVAAGPSSQQVFAVALSPNGRLLAAGGTSHEVSVWRIGSRVHPVRIATLALPAGTVYGLSFSSDGGQLAAVDASRSVYLWSVHGGRLQPRPPLIAPAGTALHAVGYAQSDQELAAAGTQGRLLVWRQLSDSMPSLAMQVAGNPTENVVGFSPNGRMLAAGGTDDIVHRWIVNRAGPAVALAPLHGFASWIEALAFSPNGQELAVGSSDNSLRIWSTSTRAAPMIFNHPAPVTGIGFAAQGTRLISVDAAGTLRAWSLPAPSAWSAPGKVFGLSYTTGGNELAVISSGPAGNAQLWNTSSPTDPVLIANVPSGSFGAVAGAGALTGNGRLLAIANARAQVQLLDVSDPHHPRAVGPVLAGATPYIEQIAFNRTGTLLAGGDDGGHINLWGTAEPSHPVTYPALEPRGSAQIILGVAFSPSGRLLASASTNGHVLLWDTSSPNHSRLLADVGHFNGYAYSVAFTPNGSTLVAGGADRTVRLWNVANPAHPREIGAPLIGPTSAIYSVSVSSDGSTLAAATTDGKVWLWNISHPATPQLLADLVGSSGDLYAVSFQPHSDTVVAGGNDQLLHFWDDSPSMLSRRICGLAGTPLTRTEWSEYVQSGTYSPPCRR